MNYRLEFEIADLPRMTNVPSGKGHWRHRKAEADLWKAKVWNEVAVRGMKPRTPLKTAKLTLTRYSSVPPDPDGLVSGFKHVVDGLVLAGVLDNDRFSNIGMPTYLWEKAARGQGKIKIIVEEV